MLSLGLNNLNKIYSSNKLDFFDKNIINDLFSWSPAFYISEMFKKRYFKPNYLPKIYKYLSDQNNILRKTQSPLKNKKNNKVAVIVEPRDHPLLESVIRNITYHLNDFNLHVFCSNQNSDRIEDFLFGWEYRKTILPYDDLNARTYSELLMSSWFWNQIEQENILIFQTDSFILNINEDQNFNMFLEYPFVGAPFITDVNYLTPKGVILNGGFSLRHRSAMLDCINKITINDVNNYRLKNGKDAFHFTKDNVIYMPEDVYYCHALEILGYNLPSIGTAKKLVIEDISDNYPIAIHGFQYGFFNDNIDHLLNIAIKNDDIQNISFNHVILKYRPILNSNNYINRLNNIIQSNE